MSSPTPRPRRALRRVSTALLLLAAPLFARPASAATDYFAPLGGEFKPPAGSGFNQIWGKVATDAAASFYAYAWTSGNNVVVRLYEADGTPRTGNLNANPTLVQGTQDEPAISIDANGHVLVCWSDRFGYDGELMGIFGSIWDSTGTPIATEIQVNVEWQASQWRPLIKPLPGGGWVVAWSGQWDGEAFLRILDTNGTPVTGDVQVNTFENGAQVDTALAVAPNGTIFTVFVDYSGFGGVGSGTNVWGRTFDSAGVPQQAMEFVVPQGSSGGDQREPRVAADGQNRFVVVWEDDTNDGDNWGVFGRRYDSTGTALGPVFQVNTTTAFQQGKPDVDADDDGAFIVVWEHNTASSVGWDVRGQRFDATGAPVDGEFTINETLPGAQRLPSLAISASGQEIAFAWEGPGNQTDVYSRFYLAIEGPQTYCTAKTNSLGCMPFLTSTGRPSVSDTDPFRIRANDLVPNQGGLLIYGYNGRLNLGFHGGKFCVKSPTIRMLPPKNSGNPATPPCSGRISRNFNQRIQSGTDPLLMVGQQINAQVLYRDPLIGDGFGDGLSDAIEFTIQP